ncbi:MAG: PTS sugar transporter subunit IIA [Verrucomicrobia bacterium]|nr:PTS sugar transporter subunit IIA [Verrucomicrobiota bacterium]MCH8512289.1 PTS sugar transporter subunit IIA [Kiritimatiellia bacterium]
MSDHHGEVLLEESLSPERVFLTQAKNKDELIHALVDAIFTSGEVLDLEALRSAVFAREALMSTGIGLGVGVPHARISSVRRLITAVAINDQILPDYESIDGGPVRIVFLVAGRPDQQSNYVRLLAAISRIVKDHDRREFLLKAQTSDEVYASLLGRP